MNPYLAGQIASERQHEMVASAARQQLARRLVRLARASRRAQRAEGRMRLANGTALRLRSELEH